MQGHAADVLWCMGLVWTIEEDQGRVQDVVTIAVQDLQVVPDCTNSDKAVN
jgi:hypothetical protein